MSATYEDRTAKWLVGDRLAGVLHLGHHPLVDQLADQGHDVVVASAELPRSLHPEVSYVRTHGTTLPFTGNAFDVVIAPDLRRSPTEFADIARVLQTDGLLSTVSQTFDESIPWLRKLRELIGGPAHTASAIDAIAASGLFGVPEESEFGSWEKLDLDGLMAFARSASESPADEDTLAEARELFLGYGAQTGSLRLRRQIRCLRARVQKGNLPAEADPPETLLLDFR